MMVPKHKCMIFIPLEEFEDLQFLNQNITVEMGTWNMIPGTLCCHSALQYDDKTKTFYLLKAERSDFV